MESDAQDSGLVIEAQPVGRNGAATVTARIDGQVIAIERCDLTKGKARAELAAEVCKGRPGTRWENVDAELLKLADELAKQPDTAPTASDLPELDAGQIIRPERFIKPEASGLAVPTMATHNGRPVGRWLLYLRWADGRRERLALSDYIDLTDGRRLWIHPAPVEPTPNMPAGWSAGAGSEPC